jgi:monoamine oxidase
MVLLATGSALVAGHHDKGAEMQQKDQLVEVTRAFCIAGKPQKVGVKITLNPRFASEMRAAGKVKYVEAPEVAPVAPAKESKRVG